MSWLGSVGIATSLNFSLISTDMFSIKPNLLCILFESTRYKYNRWFRLLLCSDSEP